MLPRNQYYENQAKTIIKALEKRYMDGYYAPTREEAVELALSLISDNSIVSWGGSMTLNEIGLLENLKKGSYDVIDRSEATSADEIREMYHRALNCDYYFMSTNAITIDGKLVNIDGNGNRIAALIYGPKNVIIIAGMNKVTLDEEAALKRIGTEAAPINTIRLNKNTPCSKTGKCHECLVDDTICCQVLVTRKSSQKGRIKVILVGEELGY